MKRILLSMLLIMGFTVFAQEITINLENFTDAEVNDGLTVNFSQGDQNKAIITGSAKDQVDITVENGVLIIKSSLSHVISDDNTLIRITYKQLDNLEAKQNSKIELCGKMNQNMLNLRAVEGSDIKAHVDLQNLNAKAVTGGKIMVIGKAAKQDIDLRASGEFKGENLIGETVVVSVIGGGKANVFGKKYVNAKTKAGGTIYVYGKPAKLDKQSTFGGTIKKIN